VTPASALAEPLIDLLGLADPPVAITFTAEPASSSGENIPAQPAGCCFWAPAQWQTLDTRPADHANCSTGSYTHGLMDLAAAASQPDTAALINSGWVTPADFADVAHLPVEPTSIRYEPLTTAASPDVVLIRLRPPSFMRLQGACPDIRFATKPQCQIIPLAYCGQIAVSPGCAISRLRTGLPDDVMSCALPGARLAVTIEQLRQAVTADQAATDFATADLQRFEASRD
jgi:uncharacterized protein (DUF169 family)